MLRKGYFGGGTSVTEGGTSVTEGVYDGVRSVHRCQNGGKMVTEGDMSVSNGVKLVSEGILW